MENLPSIPIPNCLCKLRYFPIYLRALILERSEWNAQKKRNWPILHDLIGIVILSCLKNDDFHFIKRNALCWSKYDEDVSLKDFRSVDGKILIPTRLKGYPKYINIFLIDCVEDGIQFTGEAHCSDQEEHFDCYELKKISIIPGSVHFAASGGYFMGKPVYLQYGVPRLLKSIYDVIDPIRLHLLQNQQYPSLFQYIKHLPIIMSEKLNYNVKTDEKEVDELTEGIFKLRHTNPDKLMFLSPEMCEAQKRSGIILFHYRDNERKKPPCRSTSDSYTPFRKQRYKEFRRLMQPYMLNEELALLNASASDTVIQNLNYLTNNMSYY